MSLQFQKKISPCVFVLTMRKQMPFWCCFKEKSKKFAWGQPASQCGLLYQFSGKIIFLNLPYYWWGIHEMWEENQRLCIKQQQHVSVWLILSKPLILFLWWPKEPQLYESYSCCETEQEIRMSILKKGYCPCTYPPYFMAVPQFKFCLAMSMVEKSGFSHIRCMLFILVPKLCNRWSSVNSLFWS